jgi:hypothetical protein
MRATINELPVLLEAGPSTVRGTDWDGFRVSVISVPAGTDFGPLLKGLPDDRCPGAHWGYILKGALRITHADGRSELMCGGDLYHMPPGHTGVAEEDTEFIEIADPEKHDRFLAQARQNLLAADAAANGY